MKAQDIKIGDHYEAMVSGRLVRVEVTGIPETGGWKARNTVTGRELELRSHRRLRRITRHPAPATHEGWPERPEPRGTCYQCSKPMVKPTSLWCNWACQHAYHRAPTMDQISRWEFDGVAEAWDGCSVEPDGACPHGAKSWVQIALEGYRLPSGEAKKEVTS